MDSLYFLAPFLNDYCIDLCSFGMGMCKLDWGIWRGQITIGLALRGCRIEEVAYAAATLG